MTEKKLTALIHAESGMGKSRLLDTAPGPRLIMDVEGGTQWTPSPKIRWDPAHPLPVAFEDGSPITTDTSVVVFIRDFTTMKQVYQWLATGNHYFESVGIDSITEAQKRCKDAIGGTSKFTDSMWGDLLVEMETLVRNFRDLREHPTKPINVIISALSIYKNDRWRADVQGALVRQLPGFVDVNAYMFNGMVQDGSGRVERNLLIVGAGTSIDAKDRTDILTRRFGTTIQTSVGWDSTCDLRCIVEILNGRM